MSFRNCLFDLDGTIIDSYPGIQGAFNYAYENTFSEKCTINVNEHLGATLTELIRNVFPVIAEKEVQMFLANFKERYDAHEFSNSILYPGIVEVLEILKKENVRLFIVTNKRSIPTHKILSYLQIEGFFLHNIFCSDSIQPAFNHKYELVKHIINKYQLNIDETVLIGDTITDKVAAEKNNISFIFAEYGFEKLKNSEKIAKEPSEILKYFKQS